MTKQAILLTAAVIAGAAVIGVRSASANFSLGQYPPFIETLAERFNLNQDEVKTFFDEQMQQHHEQMQQGREERLNQAVTDGVITEEQKQALLAKLGEKLADREQHHQDMQSWFESQGIDPDALHQYLGMGHGVMWHSK